MMKRICLATCAPGWYSINMQDFAKEPWVQTYMKKNFSDSRYELPMNQVMFRFDRRLGSMGDVILFPRGSYVMAFNRTPEGKPLINSMGLGKSTADMTFMGEPTVPPAVEEFLALSHGISQSGWDPEIF